MREPGRGAAALPLPCARSVRHGLEQVRRGSLAREAQRKVAYGGDPVVEKRAARDVLTFGALAKEYLDSYARPNKRSWREDERQLNASLLPKWKTRPAAEISASREHCEARAKNLASAGAPWV